MTSIASARRQRHDEYAAIEDYAPIGDGRTVALVAWDGSIDWLCLPDLDSPSVFGGLLDARQGGRFELAPEGAFSVSRRYLPDTNVLETTFITVDGVARVTDAMLLPDHGLAPGREVARKIDGVSGRVGFRWRVEPRFGYGDQRTTIGTRAGTPVATAGADAIAVCSWDAGEPVRGAEAIEGRFETAAGSSGLIALAAAHQEPLVLPPRGAVERRLQSTVAFWERWVADRCYQGPWRDAVVRSALALKLLLHAPSGAIAAAATTSLPESLGGERNWDYRFSWVRDSAFTLDALQRLGKLEEASAFFWWMLHASQRTHPRLQVLYRLDGGSRAIERLLPLEGYRRSRPVRVGNAAVDQVQLDIYGELLQAAWLYARDGGGMDAETSRRLANTADLVCHIWRQPDSGIWEVRNQPAHFTHSKMMCWVALDRAVKMADAGWVPDGHAARWAREAAAVHAFVEANCWSERKQAYVRSAGSEELDAALLFAALMGYHDPQQRLERTIDAVRRELADGPLVRRYSGEDGLSGAEGAFLTCSFWLVDALARYGRVDEAVQLMEELLAMSNDVGLYAEEIDPRTGRFLGNFPQGLVHLALINAAVTIAEAGIP
jgi:GH15 family glucan-1,4-alpha-glucosidase